MNRNNKKKADWSKIFSVIACVAIVAALITGAVSIIKSATKNNKNKNYIDLNYAREDNSTNQTQGADDQIALIPTEPDQPTIGHEEIKETEPPTIDPGKEASATKEEPPVEVQAPVYGFNENSNLLWPVEGDIVISYNMDSTIYFPTLDQYKCSPSIVIGSKSGTQVIASAPGVVENIYDDPVTGKTIIMSIGDGYKLKYGQLSDVTVAVAQNVEGGQVIGKIASPTKYFALEGDNLYFELTKDDNPVDPLLHLIEKK